MVTKPPYAIPTMAEIRALPWNGLRVASTFSGCGGSCLGYRMAGFRIVWANEFIPSAAETYRANADDACLLDTRDIRTIMPEEVLTATGLRVGELDLFDGSPPCASFSVAGKREKNWGKVKIYSDKAQRTDDLFFEYIRLLTGLKPKTFVAENVYGLTVGSAKGYFLEIFEAMKAAGYTVRCQVLDASWLGVPQVRRRCIFIGVRTDLNLQPVFPTPLPYRYALKDIIPLTRRSDISQEFTKANGGIAGYAIGREWDNLPIGGQSEKFFNLQRAHPNRPCPTITAHQGASGAASLTHPYEQRYFTVQELKRICAFPEDFILTGTFAQQCERLGRSVPPLMMARIAGVIAQDILLASQTVA